jgi:hypothetical protein
MSYDVSFFVTERVGDELNYTYNCATMFYLALEGDGGLRGLDGVTGADAAISLSRAVKKMKDWPDAFRALNPPNGWGDYDGALQFLERLLQNCLSHPTAKIRIT